MSGKKSKCILENIFSLILSSFGFLVSLYALAIHMKLKLYDSNDFLCNLGKGFDCSTVLGSNYSEILGIPLGAIGMSYFGVIFTLSLFDLVYQKKSRTIPRIKLYMTCIGALICAILASISIFKLNTVCPSCLTIYLITTLLLIENLVVFIKRFDKAEKLHQDVLKKIIIICFVVALPPIAAGLGISGGIDVYKTFTTPKAPLKQEFITKKEDLAFNASSLVGDGEDYRKGNDKAPVVIQIFSDFGCIHCKEATNEIEEAQRQAGLHNVLFIYRFFPLSSDCNPLVDVKENPYSCLLALGSRCAGEQEKFWEFKNWGFEGLGLTQYELNKRYSNQGLAKFISTLKIDQKRFFSCLDEKLELQKIKNDCQIAQRFNIKGTPLILINGQPYTGMPRVKELLKQIEPLIKK